jgi:hypothetical protein
MQTATRATDTCTHNATPVECWYKWVYLSTGSCSMPNYPAVRSITCLHCIRVHASTARAFLRGARKLIEWRYRRVDIKLQLCHEFLDLCWLRCSQVRSLSWVCLQVEKHRFRTELCGWYFSSITASQRPRIWRRSRCWRGCAAWNHCRGTLAARSAVSRCALEEAGALAKVVRVAHALFVRCARAAASGSIGRIEVAQVGIPLSAKTTRGTFLTRRRCALLIGAKVVSVAWHAAALNIVCLCQVHCTAAVLVGQRIAMPTRHLLRCGAIVPQGLACAAILVGPAPAVWHARPAKDKLEIVHANSSVPYHTNPLSQNVDSGGVRALETPNINATCAHQTIRPDHSRQSLGWSGRCSSQRPCEGSHSAPSGPSGCSTC